MVLTPQDFFRIVWVSSLWMTSLESLPGVIWLLPLAAGVLCLSSTEDFGVCIETTAGVAKWALSLPTSPPVCPGMNFTHWGRFKPRQSAVIKHERATKQLNIALSSFDKGDISNKRFQMQIWSPWVQFRSAGTCLGTEIIDTWGKELMISAMVMSLAHELWPKNPKGYYP